LGHGLLAHLLDHRVRELGPLVVAGGHRRDLDPRLASWIFYGGLEEILTGWVLGQLPDGDEEVARAERTIIDVVCGGLTVRDDTTLSVTLAEPLAIFIKMLAMPVAAIVPNNTAGDLCRNHDENVEVRSFPSKTVSFR
jgi:hypothetical protein